MKFAKVVFTLAGVAGLLVLLPQYFMEQRIGADFPPPITHPENFYGFLGVASAWQVLFLLMARDPAKYRAVMPIAALEKISFGAACVVLFMQGRVAAPVVGAGIIDLVFAALFLAAYGRTRT